MTEAIVGSGEPDDIKQWSYKARNTAGKEIKGTARAVRRQDVTAELYNRNLVPLEVKQISGGGSISLDMEFSIRKTPKPRELVLATQQLSSMLESGLTTIDAIDVVKADCTDLILKNALAEVRRDLVNGLSLAASMEKHTKVFSPKMISLVRAGEASGTLMDAMSSIAEDLDEQDQLRAKVKKAASYPLIVAAIGGVIIGAMLIFMVPKFAASFTDIGGPDAKLPFLTNMVVGVSSVAVWAIPLFLASIGAAVFGYKSVKHKPEVQEISHPIFLSMPVFGKLMHKVALARFCSTLSGLMEAGVPRLQALEITAEAVGNIRMQKAVLSARDAVQQGRSLTEPLRNEPLFPNMLIQMVEAGEKSGRTDYMLKQAAKIYKRDVDVLTDGLTALIEPLMLAGLGSAVGTVVIAMYLPYLKIGEMVGG